MKFEQIIADIKNKIFSPIYFLYGDEPYFIDQLTSYIEKNALDEDFREFNQSVVYGRDVSPKDVIDLARRFPMMGNYQLVIVKEAQAMNKIEELEIYLNAPLRTTILVISHKYKKLDKRRTFYKSLLKSDDVVLFESLRVKDNQISAWIENKCREMGFSISPQSSLILSEYLGNELGKIQNEIDKLAINLEKGATITTDEIEKHIGISKDFNVFELQKALATKNILKAQRIVQNFENSPKEHPIQMISVNLLNFFVKVYIYHHVKRLAPKEKAAELGVNPYFITEYDRASKVFSPEKLKYIISEIKTLDLKSKGVGSLDANSYAELKQLVFKIIH